MEIKEVLSCLGGYYGSNTFELDIPKIADISEFNEEEVIQEVKNLKLAGDILVNNNLVTLIDVKAKQDKEFNDLYRSVETFEWKKGEKLRLDV